MAMKDLILILNAGSSSLKFTLFIDKGEKLEALYVGQVEGIVTEPRFKLMTPRKISQTHPRKTNSDTTIFCCTIVLTYKKLTPYT
jgi:acetate kinase